MSETLEKATRQLAEARAGGDADDLAEGLALHANALLEQGQIGAAQSELDEAAAIHHTRGRRYDEARCTQLAGTLCRFQGRLSEARQRANRALELAESQGPLAVSAQAELGEIALAEGRGIEAAAAYQAALAIGETTGLIGPARAALLRRRAAALVVARQHQEAVRNLETAYELLVQAGEQTTATRALIEQATALQHGGQFAAVEPIVDRALQRAAPAGDHAALADLHLLQATQALERRDAAAAMAAAQAARTEALAANAATSYIGAALTIARLAESADNRLGAYEALATGWATLADLLGRDLAQAAFAPPLREMRERWGIAAFDEIKKSYEAGRRRAVQS